uniref:Uncharacterized protein n=1 Tax=Anguilla anguilla TaxID=7936 RepID=A0A0E9SBE6_ANGAN
MKTTQRLKFHASG